MNKNRGMFLEKILNQTIENYWNNNYAFIEKKGLPFIFNKISKNNNKLEIQNGYLSKKSTVDYIGMFCGSFVCFEAKSCNTNKFDLKNIKKHQIEYLALMEKYGSIAFIILFFADYDVFFKISIKQILIWLSEKRNTIHFEEIKRNSQVLELEFPGFLNIL
ncbi:Holliday junction resolvase RecU [Mycoplasmopsis cynos]|uniref:Holliday junction resolvase RecU n=1 Tax=Mycoplasmopsis cynos TaxID=171284 RepID=A0A449AIG8_9BACT|nr:Holliday junction resolvase RecU [Mycoplasmopsis cynos]TQC54584.1 Holliday junction resolvase RecU [Mycoplasmopsis cynos]VEU64736.1 penicillin-binding protein-related factor A recombinase [Mycoplasmopsis cynos]